MAQRLHCTVIISILPNSGTNNTINSNTYSRITVLGPLVLVPVLLNPSRRISMSNSLDTGERYCIAQSLLFASTTLLLVIKDPTPSHLPSYRELAF